MSEEAQAHCPTCDGDRTCDIHGSVKKEGDWSDREGTFIVSWSVHHSLLECRGCHTVFYETISSNSEDVDYWYDQDGGTHAEYNKIKETFPKVESKNKPPWIDAIRKIDDQLYDILLEMYLAHSNRAFILTAIGLRTALDRATELLGIDPARTFAEKLSQLRQDGRIGDTERDILDVVTNAGSAAAHRGWSPAPADIGLLLSAFELFLQRAFIVGDKALAVKANLPAKPVRREK